ncbi:MAG TPA: class I SAM-dependent methyltransferase [Vicinamibacteria bacterium]
MDSRALAVDPAAVAEAFDRVAAAYDDHFGRNPVGLLFRRVVQERLGALYPPGSRVLDLGCGTGEDALFLAERGVNVHAIDVSAAMAERARAKAEAQGLEARVHVERRGLEDLASLAGPFDGAYSNFGALNCVDLEALGGRLAGLLRPGAPVVLSFMGRWPLPAVLERALTARGEARGRTPAHVGGVALAVRHPGLAEARRQLGPAFEWSGAFALGVLVPGPEHGPWATRHPLAFGVLAAGERLVRGWPLLRGLGDHLVLEGARR